MGREGLRGREGLEGKELAQLGIVGNQGEAAEQSLGRQWSVSQWPWDWSFKVLFGNCKDLVSVKCH